MSDVASVSVERLFAEPFEPEWLHRQHMTASQKAQEDFARWRKLIIERSEQQWRLEAVKSQRRILANHKQVLVRNGGN